MKKRITEAVGIFAAIIAIIAGIIIAMKLWDDNRVVYEIDGEYYSVQDGTMELALITEDGVENLQYFTRLTDLTVTPYKYQRYKAVNTSDAEQEAQLRERVEYSFGDYTDVEDISFLDGLTGLKKLNIEGCAVSDISVISQMTKLTELSLEDTKVEDLSPLAGLDCLETLNISGIPAEDFSVLTELEGLKTVTVTADKLTEDIEGCLSEKGVVIKIDGAESE